MLVREDTNLGLVIGIKSNMSKIKNTTTEDLPFIYELFEHSITYQEEKGILCGETTTRMPSFRI